MTEVRSRRIVVILGTTDIGKTFLTRMMIADYLASQDDDVVIVDPGRQFDEEERVFPEWAGKKNLPAWIDDLTAGGQGPADGGFQGLLVLDDADRYIGVRTADEWVDLFFANRHLHLDIIVSAHRPQSIPKDLIGSAYQLILFQQDEELALEYLSKIGPVKSALSRGERVELPTEKGVALVVTLKGEDRGAEVVDFRTDAPAAEPEPAVEEEDDE